MAGTYYRIVKARVPTLDDLTSLAARGVPRPLGGGLRAELHDGISVYATLDQARSKARAFPSLGRFVARLEIPDDAPVTVRRTLPGSRGHHTIWGEPAVLLGYVTAVEPV